jgi:hypothetical protein
MRIVKADATSVFTGYSRARQVVPVVTSCALEHIGGCGGRIERAHIDHNPLNNDRQNITTLCKSHHNLYDFGRITLTNPVMPPFYVDARGARRYPQKALHAHPCQLCGVVVQTRKIVQACCSKSCAQKLRIRNGGAIPRHYGRNQCAL